MNTDNTKQLTGLELVNKLNSERTQGYAMLYKQVLPNNNLLIGVTVTKDDWTTKVILKANNYSTLDINADSKLTKEAEANAAYTALAVNHFADVVEALKLLIDRIDSNWHDITSGEQNGIKDALLKEAKQALNNIKP